MMVKLNTISHTLLNAKGHVYIMTKPVQILSVASIDFLCKIVICKLLNKTMGFSLLCQRMVYTSINK